MCGFFGVSSREPVLIKDSQLCNARLSYRGPDGSRYYHSSDMLHHAVHYRLAINDLSSAGSQPFSTAEYRSCALIFNGEIYNFRELKKLLNSSIPFYSSSDTEVLFRGLCEIGPSFLESVSGAFSFCFLDLSSQSVLLARDRFGEKPLYYRFDQSSLVYGSDSLQVAYYKRSSVTISKDSLVSFCINGNYGAETSFFDNVQQIPFGHFLKLDLNSFASSLTCYFDPQREHIAQTSPSPHKAVVSAPNYESLLHLLRTAVSRQLNSDRSSSLLLSGGVDSSIIAALASASSEQLNTYTVRFPDINDGAESLIARELATRLGTSHREINIGSFLPMDLDELLSRLDSPLSDPSTLPSSLVYREIASKHAVVLSGDGADELFGGYTHYSRILKLAKYRRLFSLLPKTPDVLKRVVNLFYPQASKWLSIFGHDLSSSPLPVRNIFASKQLEWLIPGFPDSSVVASREFSENLTPLRIAMIHDMDSYLSRIVLPKTDRVSMANSVEVRCPFLDLDVIKFSLGLPDHCLASSSSQKIILNELADSILPSEVRSLQLRKYGFSFCVDTLFRRPIWIRAVRESVYESNLPINSVRFESILERQASGRQYGHQLFTLMMLSRWALIHNVAFLF